MTAPNDAPKGVDLLPLPASMLNWPHPSDHVAIRQYALDCVDANVAELRAEVERALTLARDANNLSSRLMEQRHSAEASGERLAEALREIETELGPYWGAQHDANNPIHVACSIATGALTNDAKPGEAE